MREQCFAGTLILALELHLYHHKPRRSRKERHMTYTPTLATSAGMQRATHPPTRVRPGQHVAPLTNAAQIDREADLALAYGYRALADRLTRPALEHRTRATGGRS